MTAESLFREFGIAPLPTVLSMLNRDSVTGILLVAADAAAREFLLVDGELRAARSDAEEEKLGSWLVQQEVITEEFKQLTLLAQEGSDAPPLGHILVSRGLADADALEQQLEDLALAILERATSEKRNRCRFREGLDRGQLDTLPNTTTPQLILISARALPDLEVMRAELGTPEKVACLSAALDMIVQEYDLSLPEATLVGKLQKQRTLYELRAISALSDQDFYTAAYALLVAGIMSFHKAAPAKGATAKLRKPAAESQARADETEAKRAVKPEQQQAEAEEIDDEEVEIPTELTESQIAERDSIDLVATSAGRQTHYELIGLSPEASYQEIFNAWDSFQQRFGPTRADEPHLRDLRGKIARIYQLGEDAFEVLSSPERRPHYDRMIRTATATTAGGGAASRSATDGAVAAEVKENLARADELIKNGDIFSAVKLLEHTCDLDPKPSTLLKLAQAMLTNPKWTNRAMEKLRRAVELDPSFVEGWLEVAKFWRARNSRERQRKALERAIAADPSHHEALKEYGGLMGNQDLVRFLERVRASKP